MKIMFVGVCDLFFVWLQKTGNEEGAGKSMASHWQGQDSKPWLPHTPCSFWLYHSPLHCLSSWEQNSPGPPLLRGHSDKTSILKAGGGAVWFLCLRGHCHNSGAGHAQSQQPSGMLLNSLYCARQYLPKQRVIQLKMSTVPSLRSLG